LDGQTFWNSTVWNRGSALARGTVPLSIDIAGLQNVSTLSLYSMRPWAGSMPLGGKAVAGMNWGDARIYCGPDAPYLPTVEILSPSLVNSVGLNATVKFEGRGYDGISQALLGTDKYTWYINLLHCQGALCHTHFYQTFVGTEKGEFVTVPHNLENVQQSIYYEVRFSVTDACGRSNTASRTVMIA
jgi:hypothetical protein